MGLKEVLKALLGWRPNDNKIMLSNAKTKTKDMLIDVIVSCFVDVGAIVWFVTGKLIQKLCGECLFCEGP